MDGRRLPTNAAEETEMRSERLSVKEAAAGAYRMFSNPEDRNAVINNLKAAAAIDKNVAFEASPFTTMLELEVGKELDKRITAGGRSAHDEGTSVRNFEFADPVGRGKQAARNFSPPAEEETELRAERISAKEARSYGMFSSPEDRNDMINKMKAAAAIDKNVAFEASPFTTVLELEVGKELDKRITTAGGSVPDAGAGVRNFEFADPVGRGEQAGSNFSPPLEEEEETELRAERMSAKEARAYGMFSSPEDRNDMINKMKAAAAIDKNVAFEASPFTTVLELEVGKELDKSITAAGGSVPGAGAGMCNFQFADPVGRGEQAGRNFSSPPEEEEETELRAERMSAKEARAYGMFSSPEDHKDMINKMKAAAAIDKNVAFEASPFTTVLELEVGKELDKRITAAGGPVPDGGAGVRNFEFADPVTTVDMARTKADETIAEATSAAMKVAKEAGDVVAGHKWF